MGVLSHGEFDDLYRQYRGAVYRTIRGVVLDADLAQDIAHDAFMRAWSERERFRGEGGRTAVAWVTRIGVNLAITHLRRKRIGALKLALVGRSLERTQRDEIDEAEGRNVVEQALARVPPKYRVVLGLVYYCGFTRPEIADILGIPEGTVASRLATGTAAMRRLLSRVPVRATAG